jgi:hypothetical protein
MTFTPGKGVARGADGTYTRSAETAERDAEACRLRARGWSYPRIAAELGFANHSGARLAVARALREIVAEPAEDLRQLELARLDKMWEVCVTVLESVHYVVSDGRLIWVGPKGQERPLLDDGPALQVVDRMLKIQERRAKLLGLDAPAKTKVEVTAPPVPDVLNLIQRERERMAAAN